MRQLGELIFEFWFRNNQEDQQKTHTKAYKGEKVNK